MQVRLRKNHVPGQNKAGREADRKCNEPCTHFGRYRHAAENRYVLAMENEIECYVVDKDIKDSISPSACKVAKGLGRYYPGKWPVKKIDEPNYNMSGLRKQIVKLAAKVRHL